MPITWATGKKKMDKFLEKYNLPILSQEEIENIHKLLTEIETVIKNFPANESPGPDGFTGEFYRTFSDELRPILLKLFQGFAEEGILQNSYMRPPSS